MNVNTKEMVLGRLARNPPPQLNIGNLTVDRVAQCLQGVRSYSQPLTEIKRTCREHLLQVEQTVVLSWAAEASWDVDRWPALLPQVGDKTCRVYACSAWHWSLTVKQNNRIESFQKCALKSIFNDFTSGDNAYTFNWKLADLPQLADRREQLTRRLFVKLAHTDNCLNYVYLLSVNLKYLMVFGQQKSTLWYVQRPRGL